MSKSQKTLEDLKLKNIMDSLAKLSKRVSVLEEENKLIRKENQSFKNEIW